MVAGITRAISTGGNSIALWPIREEIPIVPHDLSIQVIGEGDIFLSGYTVTSTKLMPKGFILDRISHDKNTVNITLTPGDKTSIRRCTQLGLIVRDRNEKDVSHDFVAVGVQQTGTSSPLCKHG